MTETIAAKFWTVSVRRRVQSCRTTNIEDENNDIIEPLTGELLVPPSILDSSALV